MKKILFLIIVLSLIFFIGCTEEKKDDETKDVEIKDDEIKDDKTKDDGTDNGNGTIEVVDCGSDPACWEMNLKDCISAKFETGLGNQIRTVLTIKGLEGDYCRIHHLATINPVSEFEGTYYECLLPKDKLNQEGYQEWMQENLMTSCTGTFIDASIDLYGSPDCMGTKTRIGAEFWDASTQGKHITITEVGDNDEITVEVDGVSDTIQYLETKTINGIKIENLGIDGERVEMKICST